MKLCIIGTYAGIFIVGTTIPVPHGKACPEIEMTTPENIKGK